MKHSVSENSQARFLLCRHMPVMLCPYLVRVSSLISILSLPLLLLRINEQVTSSLAACGWVSWNWNA